MQKSDSFLQKFLHHEATAGGLLALAAVCAVLASNSGLAHVYHGFLNWSFTIGFREFALEKTVEHFINDGLMAVFFFLVGLEIKREFLEGNLSQPSQILLPAVAAIGGMFAPALVYVFFNAGSPTLAGWAIPAATDIAFALGALALVGSRVPPSLKVFLLALATLDDLGAIIIIAIFYTADLSLLGLGLAGVCLVILIGMNRLRIDRAAPYLLIGVVMWLCVLKSGVHATLAGVLLAFTIPLYRKDKSPLLTVLEERLHPYVAFSILPLFAFANAGIPLQGITFDALQEPVPLGVAAGLILGKPVGILLMVGLLVALRFARLPEGANWYQMAGLSCLAGIGFTMSLFIGGLAFGPETMDQVRLGVIVGSLVSMVLGLAILMAAPRAKADQSR